MNVKLITKALHTLSLLSEEDVATVMNLRALTEDERSLLVMVLEPQKSTTKRAGKKSASRGASKSARGASLQQQLKGTASRTITGPVCSVCGNVEDHPDHDTAHYLSAHEFNTGKPTAEIMTHKTGTGG